MNERIRLVQGDNLPYVKLTLRNADETPLDVSGATINIYFRAKGTSEILSTLIPTKPNGGDDGVIMFNFPGESLDVDPGYYEGEIEIDFGVSTQTVYETLQFQVRAQFS